MSVGKDSWPSLYRSRQFVKFLFQRRDLAADPVSCQLTTNSQKSLFVRQFEHNLKLHSLSSHICGRSPLRTAYRIRFSSFRSTVFAIFIFCNCTINSSTLSFGFCVRENISLTLHKRVQSEGVKRVVNACSNCCTLLRTSSLN